METKLKSQENMDRYALIMDKKNLKRRIFWFHIYNDDKLVVSRVMALIKTGLSNEYRTIKVYKNNQVPTQMFGRVTVLCLDDDHFCNHAGAFINCLEGIRAVTGIGYGYCGHKPEEACDITEQLF